MRVCEGRAGPFSRQHSPGRKASPQNDRALGALELLLAKEAINRSDFLFQVISKRPGFRHHWSVSRRDGKSVLLQRKTPVNTKQAFEKDLLDWCLIQLLGSQEKQTNLNHAMLFAFLQNHLDTSSREEKARVDEILYQKLSDLAAVHEMLASVRLHRPQNTNRTLTEVFETEKREPWQRGRKTSSPSINECTPLWRILIKEFYEAPLPSGQKDLAWLERSQAIRHALERFWVGFRTSARKSLEEAMGLSTEELDAHLEIISAHLNPVYIDTVEDEKQRILAGIRRASEPAAIPI